MQAVVSERCSELQEQQPAYHMRVHIAAKLPTSRDVNTNADTQREVGGILTDYDYRS